MKLSDAASCAEIVSAVGLIIALIYVGVQVTDNTRATRSETASTVSAEFIDFYGLVSGDAELAEIWLRGVTDPEALDSVESLRFVFTLHTVMLQFQNNFYPVEEGTMNSRMLAAINSTLGTIRGTKGFEMYWSNRKSRFFPEYQAYVEALMYEQEGKANALYQQARPG